MDYWAWELQGNITKVSSMYKVQDQIHEDIDLAIIVFSFLFSIKHMWKIMTLFV